MKEHLRFDRARIQVGRISHFGLLEMSRQRIRTSVLESSTEKCPHCGGTGHVRSVGSVALQLVRALEEMLLKAATHNLTARTRADVAIYVLNQKRAHLRELEERFRVSLSIIADPDVGGTLPFAIERGEQVHSIEAARALAVQPTTIAPLETEQEEEPEELGEAEAQEEAAEGERDEEGGRRRKRRRRRRVGEAQPQVAKPETSAIEAEPAEQGAEEAEESPALESSDARRDDRRRRRRGRRGGRRNRGDRHEAEAPSFPEDRFEPELTSAVADFDMMPPGVQDFSSEPGEARPASPPPPQVDAKPDAEPKPEAEMRPEPPHKSSPAAPDAPPQPEPPRRRSTVREPAPFVLSGEASGSSPVPTPPKPGLIETPPGRNSVETRSSETESPEQPRRGWWSRKLFGEKG